MTATTTADNGPAIPEGELTNEEYHAHPAISKSHLDAIDVSAYQYFHKYVSPDRVSTPPTEEMILGTAIHTAILEPHRFDTDYVAAPTAKKNSKAGKDEHAEFAAANVGKIIIPADKFAQCLAIRDAAHKHPILGRYLSDGEAERTVITNDPDTGALIKCRPDWLTPGAVILDLKSALDASEEGFKRAIANHRYHVQDPWYRDTFEAKYGEPPQRFIFAALEKSAPYDIGLWELDEDAIRMGRRQARRNLEQIIECHETGVWPGYTGMNVQTISLPGWYRK